MAHHLRLIEDDLPAFRRDNPIALLARLRERHGCLFILALHRRQPLQGLHQLVLALDRHSHILAEDLIIMPVVQLDHRLNAAIIHFH